MHNCTGSAAFDDDNQFMTDPLGLLEDSTTSEMPPKPVTGADPLGLFELDAPQVRPGVLCLFAFSASHVCQYAARYMHQLAP